ncbi:MAG: undecaprenyldiphospho-muramoylpentapeptide beta-N-acetylglucosaminyltransferase [Treponema sp.]|nr:undecaprenyldiphospho-muramoylpentapeptide beta-N-acetylglucosaminyltransferase [Treponema sp.]
MKHSASYERTFVFAGGGTGGHIYPGLAVCDELRSLSQQQNQTIRIVWLGNSSGMDQNLVEKSGSVDTFVGIPSGKLRRYFSFKNFTDFFKIFAGLVKSFFVLCKLKPVVLFSKGGFVSVPPCMAAKFLRIPVITHECDFTPGLATKINSRFASKILVSYEETKQFLGEEKSKKTEVTGNPVRPVFYSANPQNGKAFLFENRSDYDSEKPILLVLGGSLGAHQINTLVAENLDWLCQKFTVVHQCGARDFTEMPQNKNGYFLYPFIYKEMCDVIACSDIIVSRAGANSIWECSVLGKPMVLIPLCGSGTRGDQVDNAQFFAEKGAALVLLGENADSQNLKSALEKMSEPSFRAEAASASKNLSEGKRPAQKIAEIVWNYGSN